MQFRSFRGAEQLATLLRQEGIRNEQVLLAIAKTPRHLFLPEALAHRAYENNALPIGQGQTISQPYIVAKMTELLLERGPEVDQVLEIGTGSGYQSSILAQLFKKVFSVERIKSLQFQAKRKLQQCELYNVQMKHGDGWKGWSSKAPFNHIIVTAAASEVPDSLRNQLADGGVMVIPVGTDMQALKLVTRKGDEFNEETIETVRFVPLVPGEVV